LPPRSSAAAVAIHRTPRAVRPCRLLPPAAACPTTAEPNCCTHRPPRPAHARCLADKNTGLARAWARRATCWAGWIPLPGHHSTYWYVLGEGAGASLLAGSPTPRTRLVTHVTEIDRAGVAWARCRRDGTDRSHLISSARDFSSSGRSVPCPRPDPSDTQMQRKQAGGSHQPGRAESTPTKRPLPVRTSEQVSLSISAAPSSYVV
jgi:hypothetical protein